MDVSVIAIIAGSVTTITSAVGLAIRQRFKLLDHREERQLLLLLASAGLVEDFDHYTELRRAELPSAATTLKPPAGITTFSLPPSVGQ